MSDAPHQSNAECLEPDADGWYRARCGTCDFTFGPLPGLEEVLDVLMSHAAEKASADA